MFFAVILLESGLAMLLKALVTHPDSMIYFFVRLLP
jgi:hypothetical protein